MATKTSPAEFVRQVRRETNKVTWPARKELIISTIMVLVMAALASVFFLIVDNIIAALVQWWLGTA